MAAGEFHHIGWAGMGLLGPMKLGPGGRKGCLPVLQHGSIVALMALGLHLVSHLVPGNDPPGHSRARERQGRLTRWYPAGGCPGPRRTASKGSGSDPLRDGEAHTCQDVRRSRRWRPLSQRRAIDCIAWQPGNLSGLVGQGWIFLIQ